MVSHFSNRCYSTVYTKSALDLVREFFQKNDSGEWGGQKIQGVESTMDDAVEVWLKVHRRH